MAGYFCDSSAVVKRYISETGTGWIIGLMRAAAKNEFAVSRKLRALRLFRQLRAGIVEIF